MRTSIWTRLLRIGIAVSLGLTILSGCKQEKEVDYAIDGVTEESQTQSGEPKSGVAQFRDETEWKAEWSVPADETEVGSIMIDIVVDAKITVPEVEHMSVIETAEPEMDAEYKEEIASHLFTGEDIYYGDIGHYTQKELTKLQDYFESGGKITAPGIYIHNEEEYQKALTEYQTALENPKDSYTLVDAYTENEYIGTCEGISYKLSFSEIVNDFNLRRMKEIRFEPMNMRDVCPEEMKETEWITCMPWMQGDLKENHANISEEDALKEAKRFAEKLGMDYSVLSYPRPLVWKDAMVSDESMAGSVVNGYVFFFDFGVDDISFAEYGIEKEYNDFWVTGNEKEEQEDNLYSMETRLQIYVTDQGVIRMIAQNPLEMTGISERVEMLPLDTIKSMIKEQSTTEWDDFHVFYSNEVIWFDSMELIYFRVADKENPGCYSYVPTWRLANVTRDEISHTISIRNPILINAIDGSAIDLSTDS